MIYLLSFARRSVVCQALFVIIFNRVCASNWYYFLLPCRLIVKAPFAALLHWTVRGCPIINASIKVNIIITYFSLSNARPANSVHTSFIEIYYSLKVCGLIKFLQVFSGFYCVNRVELLFLWICNN